MNALARATAPALLALFAGSAIASGYPIRPAANVELAPSNFWTPRLEANREVTVWHNLQQCEQTGRVDNFRKAAGQMDGHYRGLRFDDSDFYKALEGAARILAGGPDPELDARLDELIALIAAAQQPDGYVYTVMQVAHPPGEPVRGVVPGERWAHERESHETYCMGHLIEAGVVHFEATGKRSLLDVALKAADRIAADFGPGGLELPSGHQQIEIALVKLAEATDEPKYLALAEFFLEQRGRASADRERPWGAYFLDHEPVAEQREAVGHAVRAAYQYAAMADVAAQSGDPRYREALRALWRNVAERKLYLTGGIGGGAGEGFSVEYDLPNLRAYNETCSSIANLLWQQRMFQLEGDARYVDLLERCLYNSFLSGVSMDGDTFFYPNRLASVAGEQRSAWFRCACCPPNVVRFIPQIPSLCYASDRETVYVNLYGSSVAEVDLAAGAVRFTQESDYPWDGVIRLRIEADEPAEFTLALRLPGWLERPFPSDLYSYVDADQAEATIAVNGEATRPEIDNGYARLTRKWKPGDGVDLTLPMPVRRVVADPKVASCRGRVALMRGPIVYAAEGPDNDGAVHNLVVTEGATFAASHEPELLGGVATLTGEVDALAVNAAGEVTASSHKLTAIPYYAWAHRGREPMRVWLAAEAGYAWPAPAERRYASAKVTVSGHNPWSRLGAVNDQILPTSSADNEVPRFLWDKTARAPAGAGALEGEAAAEEAGGGARWIQYDFPEPTTLSKTSVYWAANERGDWAAPESMTLLYREAGEWKPVEGDAPTPAADELQLFRFAPVETDSIRLRVVAKPGTVAGLLEWVVD